MKKLYIISVTSFMMFLVFSIHATGQRHQTPEMLFGATLTEAREYYQEKVEEGVDSLIPVYADLLYLSSHNQDALEMFRRAESKDIELNKAQQRNFSHLAQKLGQSSPYDQETGYFSTAWHAVVQVEAYCNNSSNEDFAPFFWNDLLFIASSRTDRQTGNRDRYDLTGLPFLTIYAFDQDCRTADTGFMPPSLKTSLHDGPLTISADTNIVVITRNYEDPNDEGAQNLYLGYYTRDNNGWSREKPLPFSDPAYNVQHPYFDDNTSTLYFSSDMPGSHGGFDIYTSEWDGNEWGEPINMGPEINSVYDEVFPTISPDGILIYASNHIETKGGLDLVMFKDGTRYLLPEPYNTAYDDFGITFSSATTGYFSSNRGLEAFRDNIYSFNIQPVPFVAKITDSDTGQNIEGVEVAYHADDPQLEGETVTSAAGEAVVHEGHTEPFIMTLHFSAEGYEDTEVTTDNFVFEDDRWLLTHHLEPEPVDPVEEILDAGYFVVYFDNDRPDPDSWATTTTSAYDDIYQQYIDRQQKYFERSASSRTQIEEFFNEVKQGKNQLEWFTNYLLDELEKGNEFHLLITSHTSPLAKQEYNMALSERRFVAVQNFFHSFKDGALKEYFEGEALSYEHNPYGETRADPDVSSDPQDPARSVYGVGAARERRVTITWELTTSER